MTTPAQNDAMRQLLAHLAGTPALLRGTISTITRPSGKQYYSLQLWQGKGNRCQYLSPDKLAAARQAVANFQAVQQSFERLVAMFEQRTREDLGLTESKTPRQTDSKKNSARTSSPSARKKSPG